MSVWEDLLGPKIDTKDGSKCAQEALEKKKFIGLYFSAHWCPPCKAFTPVLSAFYNDMIAAHEDFEIIFISSDRDAQSFQSYYESMSFCALPFTEAHIKNLGTKFGVRGIPTLIFLDNEARIVEEDGRSLVANSQGSVEKVWENLVRKLESLQ